jgi:very-short-patch-repair endonuclease
MRKFWSEQEDEILRKHALTHTADEIANMLPGRTTRAVHHRFGKLGIERRGVTYDKHTEVNRERVLEQIDEPLESYLSRRYVDEQATYRELCMELGIANRTLSRWLREFGIKPIGSVMAGKRNYKKHKKVYQRNLALRNTDAARCKSAKTRQGRWRRLISEPAWKILDGLNDIGLYPQPEYAIYRYNIDLAFPELKLAVEVDGGNWHQTERHLKLQEQKEKYLHEKGWTIVRVGTNGPIHQSVSRISSVFREMASTQPL